jgi:hypothetical protein
VTETITAVNPETGVYRTPEIGAPNDELRAFLQYHCNAESLYRNRVMERVARNFYYYYGRQWIAVDTEYADWQRAFTFTDELDDHIPHPVTNRAVIAVENEAARLGKSALKPHVRADTRDPAQRGAARAIKDFMDSMLREDHWPDVRDEGVISFIVGGTQIQQSEWRLDYVDSQPSISPEACTCTGCGYHYTDTQAPLSAVQGSRQAAIDAGVSRPTPNPPGAPEGEYAPADELGPPSVLEAEGYFRELDDPAGNDPTEEDPLVEMTECPSCGCQLGEFAMDAEQALAGADAFGRPLGGPEPKGRRHIEPVSIFDFFPENGGIDVAPWSMRCWGRATPRPLPYFTRHFENGHMVERERTDRLLEHHPMLAEYGSRGHWSSSLDRGIFDNHALHLEYHELPSAEFPMGRSIEMAGDIVLYDGELCTELVDSKGKAHLIQRKQIDAVRYKVCPREFYGRSLVDDIIGPQNRINQIDSQVEATLDYFGAPNLMVPVTSNMQQPVWWDEYGSGKIVFYEPDINQPNVKPEPIGGQGWASSSDTWRVREAARNDFDEIAGNMQVEMGGAPPGVTAASALQYVGEKAGLRREPKARALEALYGRQFTHQLKLIATFGTEDEEYDVVSKNGRREVRYLETADIVDIAGIEVQMEPTADMRLWKREAIKEGIALGLYQLDSAATVRRVLEAMEMPTDINEDANLQVLAAEDSFVGFRDEGIVPPIDMLHDNWIQYQTLGTQLMGDEGTELRKASGWLTREVQQAIFGWERVRLARLNAVAMAQDALQNGVPEGPDETDPKTGAVTKPAKRNPLDEKGAMAAQQALLGQLPRSYDLQIELIWTEMLEQAGVAQKLAQAAVAAGQSPEVMRDPTGAPIVDPMTGMPVIVLPQALRLQMSFEAVVQAHKLLDQEKKMAAMAGAGVVAAPGGSSSPAGMVPTPGQAVKPGQGQAIGAATTPAGM